LVFLRDGASELSEVVTLKYSKKKKLQNNGKFQEFFLFLKKEKKKTQKITPPYLCFLTLVYEKLLLHRFQEIQEKYKTDLTGSRKHGFKKNFSTETACLEIQTKMSNARDSGDYTLNFLRLILVKFKGLFLAHCYLYFSSHLLQTLLLQLPLWKTTTSLAVERQRKSTGMLHQRN
jgi:hypothetical protein